ncbi:MAG: subclass B3 metallo-beta-lactamase [Erythrobacter sp.]
MFVRIIVAATTLALTGCITVSGEDGQPGLPGMRGDQQAFVDACEPWDDWDKPAPPFKVHANTYYVGTCGIAAILIADAEGHILLDSGTEAGARIVASNVSTAGFELGDVQLLGFSHEHFDHVGGMAYLQDVTGAALVSLKAGAEVMRTGASDPGDPQHGTHEPFKPVRVDFVHEDGDAMGAGSLLARSFATPGHTPGATTWQWEACDGEDCKTIVYADSLSPVSADDYRFSDHLEYVAEYRAGLEKIANLECDILLTPHPSHSKMLERMEARRLEGGMSCAEYATGKVRRLDKRLAQEAESE